MPNTSRFNLLTRKQKRLVLHLYNGSNWEDAADAMGITKRSVYRLAAGIRSRLEKDDARHN